MSTLACFAARIVLAVAWFGLAVQFTASADLTGSVGAALWGMLRYFTIIANLLVAVLFVAIASGWRAPATVLGGITMIILLVGVVHALLLRGLLDLSGGAALADFVLHRVTPPVVALWWLAFAPKGGLSERDPLIWTAIPAIYFVYALRRGSFDGIYPYPFMDVGALGWTQVIGNTALIATAVLVAGFALVALDRFLARRD